MADTRRAGTPVSPQPGALTATVAKKCRKGRKGGRGRPPHTCLLLLHGRGLGTMLLEEAEIFCLPRHRVVDTVPPARMVEEDPFFEWAGAHLAIFAEVNRALREAVGLARGVESVHIGFVLGDASFGIRDRSQNEKE